MGDKQREFGIVGLGLMGVISPVKGLRTASSLAANNHVCSRTGLLTEPRALAGSPAALPKL
jgi:hypothetical protein